MKLKKKKYEQAPDGSHLATLADIEELGESSFGKPQLRLVFLIDKRDAAGEPIRVTELCSASTHKDAKLTGFIRTLTNSEPPDELETEDLLGLSMRIKTEQSINTQGKTYANIVAQNSLKAGEKGPAIPLNFQRAQDLPQKKNFKPNGGLRAKTAKAISRGA